MASAGVGWKFATQPTPLRAATAPPAAFCKVSTPVSVSSPSIFSKASRPPSSARPSAGGQV
jgi:hypothetical protein